MLHRESNAKTYARKFPKTFVRGYGMYLYDDENIEYTDCLGNAGTLSIGHNHPVIKRAMLEYIASELPQQMLDLATPAKIDFINELYRWLPEDMQSYCFQCCGPSGSDAVEAALKLCRIATGRTTIISFTGGFHGQTLGSLSLMGNLNAKQQLNLPVHMCHVLPYPNSHHTFMSDQSIIDLFEQLLTDAESGLSKPAGVILEAVQGEGGVVIAPFEWLREIRRLCALHDVPLIIDEVQAGFMRTGKQFAFMHSGITPDVIVMSKGVGGSQPLALIAYNPKLDTWTAGAHTGTFRGNQLAFVTGKNVLEYMRINKFEFKVEMTGKYFLECLEVLRNKYPHHIVEIRGIGLMIGILIGTGGRFDGSKAKQMQQILFNEEKLIIECGGRDGSVLRFLGYLEISLTEIDKVIEKLDRAFGKL
jgi:diaminobutyrate-2-oxoglutarate transaminase